MHSLGIVLLDSQIPHKHTESGGTDTEKLAKTDTQTHTHTHTSTHSM